MRAIVSLCAELDTILIAEGVESTGEAGILRELGVRHLQGYLIAAPEFERLPEINLSF